MAIFTKPERRIITIAKEQLESNAYGNSIRDLRSMVQTLVQILHRVAVREMESFEEIEIAEKGHEE